MFNIFRYKLGKFVTGNNASLTETVIKSIFGVTIIKILAEKNLKKLQNSHNNFIPGAVSAGLLAYINYEDKIDDSLETNANDEISQILNQN